jgi:hypothetical protein
MNIFDSWTVAPRLPCRRPGPMHPKGRAEPDPLHRECGTWSPASLRREPMLGLWLGCAPLVTVVRLATAFWAAASRAGVASGTR